ncbi:MAG: penicillin-insensitive murein endopeptidase [Polyangiales bacterium]
MRWICDAFDAVRRKFKKIVRLRVHDISDNDGGPMHDHKSHQSGRDVDMSYYQKSCGDKACAFESVRSKDLDAARQWTLFYEWIKNGQLEMVFVDYKLQAPLYRYAKKQGATAAQLEKWFQYPRGKNHPAGIIRHYAKHVDHFHARFVCPIKDRECR